MDRLWSPWRYEYLRKPDQEGFCVFCTALQETDDVSHLVLFRGTHIFIILNLFPYNTGHLLLATKRHIAALSEAQAEELHEMIDLARRCEDALRREYRPHGFNLGFNIGRAAGAGVEHHLHMHILPRWIGDSNFVSVVGETRVLPEELPTTYRRLKPYF